MATNFDFTLGRSSPFRLPLPFMLPPSGILPMGLPLIGQNQSPTPSSSDSYGQGRDLSNDPFVLMAMLASRANDPMKQMNDMMQMAQMIGQIVGQLFQQMQSRPTGNLSWFGRELDSAAFLQLMAEEKRLIYEFEVIRTYGMV